ncbi:hypothetical protein SVIOM342S_07797 [Streptomyces violaceorubidus]
MPVTVEPSEVGESYSTPSTVRAPLPSASRKKKWLAGPEE